VLALTWPDVTVFVVALLFGVRTVLFGLSQPMSVFRRWRQPAAAAAETPEPERRTGLQRGLRITTRAAGLVVAWALLAVSLALRSEEIEVPAFYDSPGNVPDTPGELLRSETFDAVPGNAQGWRILYTTTTSNGEPAVGSAFVMAPEREPSASSTTWNCRSRQWCGATLKAATRHCGLASSPTITPPT
jgi:hypothetical protein